MNILYRIVNRENEYSQRHNSCDIQSDPRHLSVHPLAQNCMSDTADSRSYGIIDNVNVGKSADAGNYLEQLERPGHHKSYQQSLKAGVLLKEEGEKQTYGNEDDDIDYRILGRGFCKIAHIHSRSFE